MAHKRLIEGFRARYSIRLTCFISKSFTLGTAGHWPLRKTLWPIAVTKRAANVAVRQLVAVVVKPIITTTEAKSRVFRQLRKVFAWKAKFVCRRATGVAGSAAATATPHKHTAARWRAGKSIEKWWKTSLICKLKHTTETNPPVKISEHRSCSSN